MLVNWSNDWIKVVDELNNVVIDDFDYESGIQGPITQKHCVKCIAVNQCWFANEKNKKPDTMEYSIEQVLNDSKNKIGLYHYNCHCKEIKIPTPNESDIELICPKGKEEWLFKDKSEWIRALGHEPDEKFLEYLKNKIIENYCLGQYAILGITNYGVAINVFVDIEGGGVKSNKIYRVRSGWMVFSNGKLKCNTFIGGKAK
ncbi:MAG: hypothetical protein K2L52_02645 [Clostridia bacterium]|nr:hypothetical protein [Clostridia bacterium]